ncbi:hypothetical protein [Bradyrhizobium genosp. A]|uniref:hypothetical protein n=1 Tax=Bradyrhizobium genosp. A TaxID=83626 RepID=UPI003CEC016C
MTKFSKELRQQIVEDFARRHNGQYDPALFLKEVRETGESHLAFDWFEWEQAKAAQEHNLWQARAFAKDLRIKFEVQVISSGKPITVTTEAPLVMSPASGRKDGGGYLRFNPDDPAHQAELCQQAAVALRSWLKRYQAALIHCGYGPKVVEQMAASLEAVTAPATTEIAA